MKGVQIAKGRLGKEATSFSFDLEGNDSPYIQLLRDISKNGPTGQMRRIAVQHMNRKRGDATGIDGEPEKTA